MFKKFNAVLKARILEFKRDRSALGWNVIFPVLVVFGFAFAFSGDDKSLYKVGVLNTGSSNPAFLQMRYIHFVPFDDVKLATEKVRRHQIDLLFDAEPPHRYWVNSSSPKGYTLEQMMKGSGLPDIAREVVEGEEIRYVDWLISGLLAMNIMFSALFGVGYALVRYRKNGVLKRLKATPLGAFEFLCAQVVSRLILVTAVYTVVYFGCHIFLRFQMVGSYLDLFIVLIAGTFCLITMSLIISARTSSEELASGLLNLISWPMMFLSGVWFSLEGTNEYVQKAAQLLPLTHMIEASRAIMIDGAGLAAIAPNLIVLTAMSLAFLIISSVLFRWDAP